MESYKGVQYIYIRQAVRFETMSSTRSRHITIAAQNHVNYCLIKCFCYLDLTHDR